MRQRLPTRNALLPSAALVAALLLLALPAHAQSQGPAGTVVIDAVIDAQVTELRVGPLTVPNPQLPNPFYDTLQRTEPVTAPLPVHLEDAPDGLYLETEATNPIRVITWAPGIGQRTITPIQWVGQVLHKNTGLPVTVTGCACIVPPTLSPPGTLKLPVAGHAPEGELLGSPASNLRLDDEPMAPGPALETAVLPPQAYAPAMAHPERPARAEGAAAPMVLPSDGAQALAAVLAAGAALLALKLLLPLYHRFRRKTALDNPTRGKLYELLRAAPGASAAELSQASALHVTTVKYHLDVLRRVGMVGEQVVDGCRRFYSYENGDRLEFLTRALLDEPAARAIYRQIETHPGLPFIEVARSLGMRKEHVHYHVKKLAKHGLLTDRWEGGRRLLFVAQPASAHEPMQPEVRA